MAAARGDDADETTTASVVFSLMNLRVLSDGRFFRSPPDLDLVPASSSSSSDGLPVSTTDLLLNPALGVSARLYLPSRSSADSSPLSDARKLPLLLYFHGGGFIVGSTALPADHGFLCKLASYARVLIVSVDYRLAPEHPLPAAYHDCFGALLWLNEQAKMGDSSHPWLAQHGDFSRCFLGGDSAGGNIVHHVAMKMLLGLEFGETIPGLEAESVGLRLEAQKEKLRMEMKVKGLIFIHPFFRCGAAKEASERETKVWALSGAEMGGSLADPLLQGGEEMLNKATSCAEWPPSLIAIAGKDFLRDRGKTYHTALCQQRSTLFMSPDEEHVFHLHHPLSPNLPPFLQQLSAFINPHPSSSS